MGQLIAFAQPLKKALILLPGSSCCHCLAGGCNSVGKLSSIVLYQVPQIANSAAVGS